jgi:hypothetical protein
MGGSAGVNGENLMPPLPAVRALRLLRPLKPLQNRYKTVTYNQCNGHVTDVTNSNVALGLARMCATEDTPLSLSLLLSLSPSLLSVHKFTRVGLQVYTHGFASLHVESALYGRYSAGEKRNVGRGPCPCGARSYTTVMTVTTVTKTITKRLHVHVTDVTSM